MYNYLKTQVTQKLEFCACDALFYTLRLFIYYWNRSLVLFQDYNIESDNSDYKFFSVFQLLLKRLFTE